MNRRAFIAGLGGAAGGGACAAGNNTKNIADRMVGDRLSDLIPIFPRCISGWTESPELR
jgi:hypothetical protein